MLCRHFSTLLKVGLKEGSGKPGWLEIKRYTSVLFDVDDVNILDESVSTVLKNTEVLKVASKEIRLQVNADKTKYIVMSRY
jgi:hypothetical protein